MIKIDISSPHGRRTLTVLVDSETQENFIDQRIMIDIEIPRQTVSIKVRVINGYSIRTYGLVGCKTHTTDGRNVTRSLPQTFISTDIAKYDAILGWPWLINTDCDCYWKKKTWYYHAISIEDVQESHIDNMAQDVDTYEIMAVYIWPFMESGSIQNVGVSLYASEVISLPAK